MCVLLMQQLNAPFVVLVPSLQCHGPSEKRVGWVYILLMMNNGIRTFLMLGVPWDAGIRDVLSILYLISGRLELQSPASWTLPAQLMLLWVKWTSMRFAAWWRSNPWGWWGWCTSGTAQDGNVDAVDGRDSWGSPSIGIQQWPPMSCALGCFQ